MERTTHFNVHVDIMSDMDGKRERKRRTIKKLKSNGRSEEKPKVPEVTSEKEQKDRLEAASVLSSLCFLPPKSSDTESDERVDECSMPKSSSMLTQFSCESGIPVRASSPHHDQGRLPRGRGCAVDQLRSIFEITNKPMPEQLLFLANGSANAATLIASLEKIGVKNSRQLIANAQVLLQSRDASSKLPSTVNPSITVNKTVASALRQAVSNNLKNPYMPSPTKQFSTCKNEDQEHIDTDVSDKTDVDSVSKKKDATDTNLPLKKRRLIGIDAEDENLSSRLQSFRSGPLESSADISNESPHFFPDAGLLSLSTSATEHKQLTGSYRTDTR